ncbi:M13-type metalloendopeptidase [Kineosporia sp. NBRC 101731]|uniref:M13 family metallopeptidase n=1 Tax=Kineosporia sp. NBRC 101731 TaxID=3032199 RepID=UPI0024A1FE44|nr:M13-type metalloendopeptidase [Kineosporia sp. NBRC 101731]GLY28057.1 peptidase M13 [Kineosporia sp. NBRC 101731]
MRSGIEIDQLSPSIRPQDDLFRHVNGTWLDTAEIPPDKSVYGTFHRLRDEAEAQLRVIVESAAASTGTAEPGSEAQKVGDLYASFMDEEAIERLGIAPIATDLALVEEVTNLAGLIHAFGVLERSGSGSPFGYFVNNDAMASDRYVMYLSQGGLSLPDESYYRDEKFAEIRTEFLGHVARMFTQAGITNEDGAADAARRILALETRLASSHWDRVTNRDATKTYNKVDRAALEALIPEFDWTAWIDALKVPQSAFAEVVVRQPSFFTALGKAFSELPIADWKTWLTWRTLHGSATLLNAELVEENFSFYGKTLTGATQLRERWKRGVSMVESALGEAVGKLYVDEHFSPTAKARMVELVANLVEAYRQSIVKLDWMSEETRGRALEKLDSFTPKIGYPDAWRDYSSLEIRAGDLVGNVRRAGDYEIAREIEKLGKPVDRDEWFMTPQTVNAYYNPLMNEIVFPAAILQPPFFDAEADDAANYGAIGAVIGHEIGHGFDDQGSKYDGSGNLNDWWTDADRTEFEKRTKALIAQYDALEPAQTPGHHVNGALTVGENIGDLGGLSIAHKAYRIALDGQEAPALDGLTGPQRFFISWAQGWRSKGRDTEVIRRLSLDPHSPEEFRCNAVVANIDEFHTAFEVKDGDGLWLDEDKRVHIW